MTLIKADYLSKIKQMKGFSHKNGDRSLFMNILIVFQWWFATSKSSSFVIFTKEWRVTFPSCPIPPTHLNVSAKLNQPFIVS